MSTQSAAVLVQARPIQPGPLAFRAGLFVLLLICALGVFIFGCNYFVIFPTNQNLTYNVLLSAGLLAAALWLKHDKRWARYWQIAFAFFVGSSVFPITLLAAESDSTLLGWFNLTAASSQGQALLKLREAITTVVPIIVLIKLSRADLGSIYLKRGNLKWGLSIGGLVVFNFAASVFLFFPTRFSSMDTLTAAVIWGAVYSFVNGFMEELWLRGIFLKRLEPLIGAGGAILLTSIVFSLLHGGAGYMTPVAIPFLVMSTFTLGLACGYLMMKTDSIWGPTLLHAASDFFLFIAVLASV